MFEIYTIFISDLNKILLIKVNYLRKEKMSFIVILEKIKEHTWIF